MSAPVMTIRCGRATAGRKKCRRVLATVTALRGGLVLTLAPGQNQLMIDELLAASRGIQREQLKNYEERFLIEPDIEAPKSHDPADLIERIPIDGQQLRIGRERAFLIRKCVPLNDAELTGARVIEVDPARIKRLWSAHRLDVSAADIDTHNADAHMLTEAILNRPSRSVH